MQESLIRSGPSIDFDPDLGKVTVRNVDHFPREIFEVSEQVRILDLSTVNIPSLPEDFVRLTNLQVFFNSFNRQLEEVPEVLGACERLEFIGMRSCNISNIPEASLPPSLRALTLTDNKLTRLPQSIGKCTNLQHFMLTGNGLQSLPPELGDCKNLEKVRLSVNDMASSPDWFLQMPRLAWYVDSGNPFSLQADTSQVREIDQNDVALGDELGKSANNVVYRGELSDGQEVAVKMYGHDLVTDGRPEDDMIATMLIGKHPNVIGGIGKLVNVPDGQQALVMPLIPAGFKTLAGPPNLSTVCRDVYPDGQTFSLPYVQNVLRSVSSAMVHLHSKGVMNGDLYGHNILANDAGVSYVGDFGAATVYKAGSSEGRLRERVDVRGFGVLMEELLDRCQSSPGDEGTVANLQQLTSYCLGEVVAERPSFAEIAESLG